MRNHTLQLIDDNKATQSDVLDIMGETFNTAREMKFELCQL